jgi:1,4-alpha-glucan branching enzyme
MSPTWGSPTSSSCRCPSTPTIRPGATRRPGSTRRPRVSASRKASPASSTAPTAPASASSWTGCPLTSRPTRTGSRISMAPRSTSTPTRARAFTPTGTPRSTISAAVEVSAFLVNNALFWAEKYHVDGLRVDAVASMLYLDYSRKAGEWIPNQHGGRENLEAVDFLRAMNEAVYGTHPGIVDDRGGIDLVAEGLAARPRGRPRLRLQVEHGLHARHTRLSSSASRCTAGITTTRSRSGWSMRFAENFVLPLSHDEVVHGKGSLLRQDVRRRLAEVCDAARLLRLHVGLSGQEAPVHGAGVRPAPGVERGASSLDWELLAASAHEGVRQLLRDLNRAYRAEPALHARDCEGEGFRWLVVDDRANSVFAWLRIGAGRAARSLVSFQLHARPAQGYPCRCLPMGRAGAKSSTPMRPTTAAGVGAVACIARRRGRARRRRADLTLPPLSTILLERQPAIGDDLRSGGAGRGRWTES